MGTRIGLRVGGFAAAFACALLVACGGGGGGGTTGGGGGVVPTLPPATLSPTSQSTTAPITTSGGTVSFGGVSAGGVNAVSSGSLTIAANALSANTTASVAMQATLPTGGVTPAIKSMVGRKVIGGTITNVLAYFTLSVNPGVTISSTPAFSLTFPNAITGTAYVAVYDTGTPGNGWNVTAGPVTASGTTLTFPANTLTPPFSLVANDTYIFAVFTATNVPTPTPVPTATPVTTATPAPTATPAIGTAPTLPPVETASGAYSPFDIASTFNYLVQSGFDGQGETIAIIGDMPPALSDLNSYVSTFSIPSNPVSRYSVVNVTVPSPTSDPGGQQEAVLDVETVMGLAPGATIVFYNTQGDLSNQYFLAAENAVAASNGGSGPDVFSISFGGCEQYPLPVTPPGSAPPDATTFAGMNANHTAVTVSAGDEGDNCTTGTTPAKAFGVDYPGSDPNVISVGGNETVPGSYLLTNPVTWNDNFFGGQSATGGGVSTTFAIPSYQSTLGSSAASTTYRNSPDVAMPAEGVSLILNGAPAEFGGTSWSAPEMAAMYAEWDEYCGGRPTGNPVSWLYTAYQRSAANFTDVTSGNNKWNATDSVVTYAAHAGYDNNTGLGLPKAQAIAQSICASRTWAGGRSAMSATQALGYEPYGATRDTVLPFAERFTRSMDLGDRNSNDQTTVTLVLRRTPTAAGDEQAVIASLQAAGFTIQQTFPNHALVQVSGTAAAVNRYFNTSIHNVSQGNYGTKYANATALTVPAAIAPYVNTVLADTLVARTPKHHIIR